MATAPALMTTEHYLRTSFSPDADFVDGGIEERNLRERDHGRLQGLIFAWFLAGERSFKAVPIVGQRIRVSTSKIRTCDVTVLRSDAPYQPVTSTPPLICIDVPSPEDTIGLAESVLADHRTMGVENIRLADPIRSIASFFNEAGLHVAENNTLRVAGTEIALEMVTLFEALDETNA